MCSICTLLLTLGALGAYLFSVFDCLPKMVDRFEQQRRAGKVEYLSELLSVGCNATVFATDSVTRQYFTDRHAEAVLQVLPELAAIGGSDIGPAASQLVSASTSLGVMDGQAYVLLANGSIAEARQVIGGATYREARRNLESAAATLRLTVHGLVQDEIDKSSTLALAVLCLSAVLLCLFVAGSLFTFIRTRAETRMSTHLITIAEEYGRAEAVASRVGDKSSQNLASPHTQAEEEAGKTNHSQSKSSLCSSSPSQSQQTLTVKVCSSATQSMRVGSSRTDTNHPSLSSVASFSAPHASSPHAFSADLPGSVSSPHARLSHAARSGSFVVVHPKTNSSTGMLNQAVLAVRSSAQTDSASILSLLEQHRKRFLLTGMSFCLVGVLVGVGLVFVSAEYLGTIPEEAERLEDLGTNVYSVQYVREVCHMSSVMLAITADYDTWWAEYSRVTGEVDRLLDLIYSSTRESDDDVLPDITRARDMHVIAAVNERRAFELYSNTTGLSHH